MAFMKCSQKEDLQQKCAAGSNACVAATKESGLAVGPAVAGYFGSYFWSGC
jgi:hypothetical protein